jgi:hypothetical protein
MSCSKDESNQFFPTPGLGINDTTWTPNTIRKSFLDSVSDAFTISAITTSFPCSSDKLIKLNDSAQIQFTPYACVDPNTNIAITNGNIDLTVAPLRNKGDYIKEMITTTSTKYLLLSGGSFYVQVSQNNNPLAIAPTSYYTIKWQDVNPQSNMQYFGLTTLTNLDSLCTWNTGKAGTVSTWDSSNYSVNKKGYSLTARVTGWVSAASFLDTVTTARTRANILMSSANFTNKNTLVFMVFNNQRTVVKLIPDYVNRCFYSLNIPLGASVTLFSISVIDGNFYLGTKNATVNSANPINLLPQQSSIPAIIAALNNLN